MGWLREVAASHFPAGVRILDEATACILGYLDHVRDGKAYALVDFGGGTLDVSLVRTDLRAEGGTRCRLLARAGEEIGGVVVDQWVLEWVQEAEELSQQDVADMGTALLAAVEGAKIAVSNGAPRAPIEQFSTRRSFSHSTRSGVENRFGSAPAVVARRVSSSGKRAVNIAPPALRVEPAARSQRRPGVLQAQ